MAGLEAKALASGASKCYVEDLRHEFLTDYVFPTMQAGAIYERDYLLGTSFARPLIAKKMVEIAELEGADAVAHGATGKGNDQVRFELTVMALNPSLRIIAPWREWTIRGRKDALEYAAEHNVPVKATMERIYSQDRNMWHLSNEGGALEDPWNEPPADMFEWTTAPELRAGRAGVCRDLLPQGHARARQRRGARPVGILQQLNGLGAKHGIGRVDIVENRLVGMKSRGVYETPGWHDALQGACRPGTALPRQGDAALQADGRSALCRTGLQRPVVHAAARGADAFVNVTEQNMTGDSALQALQGQRHPGRPQEPLQPLPRGLSSLLTKTTSTTKPTPKALSSYLVCR